MEKKFSIIVPAYNAACYLVRCLDSLLDQDLPSEAWEVIVVNDGSTDRTADILQEYAARYCNLCVVSTPNQGVSEARNLGCRLAKGSYLIFVDADDRIEPRTLKRIYRQMEDDSLDLLVMDYRYWDAHKELPKALPYAHRCKDGTDVLPGFAFMQLCLPPVVWSIVYRTSFWREQCFRFLPIRHEDEELIPRVFYLARRVKFLPIDFYHYHKNPDSFMMNYDERSCLYMLQAMRSLDEFRLRCVDKQADSFFQNLIARNLLKALKRSIAFGAPERIQKEMIAEMRRSKLTPLPQGKSFVYTWLYHCSPSLFIAYYRTKAAKR